MFWWVWVVLAVSGVLVGAAFWLAEVLAPADGRSTAHADRPVLAGVERGR